MGFSVPIVAKVLIKDGAGPSSLSLSLSDESDAAERAYGTNGTSAMKDNKKQ